MNCIFCFMVIILTAKDSKEIIGKIEFQKFTKCKEKFIEKRFANF